MPGFSPRLAGKAQSLWERRGRRDGCRPRAATRDTLPFHFIGEKCVGNEGAPKPRRVPAIDSLTHCTATGQTGAAKREQEQTSSGLGLGQNHLFLGLEPKLDWTKKLKGKWVCHSPYRVSCKYGFPVIKANALLVKTHGTVICYQSTSHTHHCVTWLQPNRPIPCESNAKKLCETNV